MCFLLTQGALKDFDEAWKVFGRNACDVNAAAVNDVDTVILAKPDRLFLG